MSRHLYFGNGSEADDITFDILHTKVLSIIHCVAVGRHKLSNITKGVTFHKLPTDPQWKKPVARKIKACQRNQTVLCLLITSLRIAMREICRYVPKSVLRSVACFNSYLLMNLENSGVSPKSIFAPAVENNGAE